MKKLVNKIVCEKAETLLSELSDKSVDLVISDPPYNASNSNLKMWKFKTVNEMWDKTFDPIPFLDEAFRVIKDWGSVLVFCSYHLLGKYLMYPKKVQQIIHWNHVSCVPSLTKTYHPCVEYVVWYSTPRYTFNKPAGRNVIKDVKKPYQLGEEKYHPTQKPVELMERLLKVHSNEGDIIVDPFCGSGSTCVAAANLNRKFIWGDFDPQYCGIATKRINELWVNKQVNKETEKKIEDGSEESQAITEGE